ncbi:hypothetical protein H5410_035453 [Solanum commersonii]|uniref:Uncharacterized protein n=1 Tax=Solanum commersonii TaxID=4109 RepID=A0A9J5Y1Y0_SOLCO|nr:hypothetical protein H5410_035453 [Solanum commersonii]
MEDDLENQITYESSFFGWLAARDACQAQHKCESRRLFLHDTSSHFFLLEGYRLAAVFFPSICAQGPVLERVSYDTLSSTWLLFSSKQPGLGLLISEKESSLSPSHSQDKLWFSEEPSVRCSSENKWQNIYLVIHNG